MNWYEFCPFYLMSFQLEYWVHVIETSAVTKEMDQKSPIESLLFTSFTAGVQLCSCPLWDGFGGGSEEQEDFCGCDQH